MFDPLSDESDIVTARSRYNARRTESSLIAWICDPTWAPHPEEYPKSDIRGAVYASTHTGYPGDYAPDPCDTASGEINASTCHCHTGNGKAW